MQFTDCYFVNEKLIYYDNSHGDGRTTLNNSMNKKQIHFYTYGDSKKYKVSKKHLIHLAKLSGLFDKLYSFSQ